MGVFEDAIRDHLQLKRKHGADEEEVRRQEAEALGPARREPPPPHEAPVPEGEPAVAAPGPGEPGAEVHDQATELLDRETEDWPAEEIAAEAKPAEPPEPALGEAAPAPPEPEVSAPEAEGAAAQPESPPPPEEPPSAEPERARRHPQPSPDLDFE
jgi:hypothetical protein